MKKLVFLSLFLTLLLTGCGAAVTSNNTPGHTAETRTIDIKNFAFIPTTMNISTGDTIIWTNQDTVAHSILGENFKSDPLATGQTYQHTFDKAGNYPYICGIHPTMKATIIVK